ncbi:serine/arginine-rich splicing factor SC35-like [Gossypium australe]|uniref:Serine/arginine-rich splicing factor SC35-like n=1 Tax=Gossypium australe TaxID=47621 RepID=A0A5B6V128_9ROSI|nr:serine/arginine-rich splicing factor SC35-like [Gossypium australe]
MDVCQPSSIIYLKAFIPNKRTISGKWFGFVRYANMYDANRAIYKINELWVMTSHIDVNMLRFDGRSTFWRKRTVGEKEHGFDNLQNKVFNVAKIEDNFGEDAIMGFVDNENLHTLQRCMVGWCKLFIKIEDLANQINESGLESFIVVRISGS